MRIENSNPSDQPKEKLTYKEYKQLQQKKIKRQNMMMFLSIFAVLIIIFLGVVRLMSPDVDISLGDDSLQTSMEEEYSRGVDSRLKALQQEDDMNLSEHDQATMTEEDGVVKIPKHEDKSFKPIEDVEPVATNHQEKTKTETAPELPNSAAPTALRQPAAVENHAAPAPVTYRVYVGMYSNQVQAEVARGILQEAGLGVTPNIKQTAGGYTLQVGAFSSKASASNLSNKLLMNNYPARVVSE